ncbi:MAG: metal ABC transporter substrate-binding protein [Alcaligenaceae bacterium]|nr:metal ABC transporter substrate-binding protein [Alcaligenaceae bacterium]
MSLNKILSPYPHSRRRRRWLGMAAGTVVLGAWSARAVSREPLPVVATFSILGDMVKEIGGERVAVTTLVGSNADAHGFEPTPRDAKALRDARVLVLNGLDFEAWLPRLTQAAGFEGQRVLASEGVKVRYFSDAHEHDHDHDHEHDDGHGHAHAHGDVDPHAWQDLSNGMIYARNIAAGLTRADPRNASYYESRAAGYVARMKALDSEVRTALAAIPPENRRVISSHDAFGYFGAAYGIEFIPIMGVSSQAEPSARDVARVVERVRETQVGGVFIENMSSPALAQQIARESGAIMGGTLYSDALGPADEPASSYLGMFSWNAGRLVYVLKRSMQNQ